MAEYEMTAFRKDSKEPVQTMWFGHTPSDEWVHRLAEEAELGEFQVKSWNGHVRLGYENGHINVHKHRDTKSIPMHERTT